MEEVRCPTKVFIDSGVAFGIGFVLGGSFHAIKGYRTYPKRRLFGMRQGVIANAPRIGGTILDHYYQKWGEIFIYF